MKMMEFINSLLSGVKNLGRTGLKRYNAHDWLKILRRIILIAIYMQISFLIVIPINNQLEIIPVLKPIKTVLSTSIIGGNPPGKRSKLLYLEVDNKKKRFYVIDAGLSKIMIWDLKTNRRIKDLDAQAVGKESFIPSVGASDYWGRFYVLDKINHEITVFSSDYEVINSWQVSRQCHTMAVDKKTRLVYVVNKTGGVSIYTADGEEIWRFGEEQFKNINYLASDARGNLYALDWQTPQVVVFNPKGELKRQFTISKPVILSSEFAVGRHSMVLSHPDRNEVAIVSLKGRLKSTYQQQHAFYAVTQDDHDHIYLYEADQVVKYKKSWAIKYPMPEFSDALALTKIQVLGTVDFGLIKIPFPTGVVNYPCFLTDAFLNNFSIDTLEYWHGLVWLISLLLVGLLIKLDNFQLSR